MKIYTKKGDAGDTGLLFGGARVSKAGGRTEAAGCVDEAVAVLGVARAALAEGDGLASLVIRLQRELFVVGAELSTHRIRRARLTPGVSLVTGEMVETLELEIDRLTKANPMPVEFIVPGESRRARRWTWPAPSSAEPSDERSPWPPPSGSRTRWSCPT